MTHSSVANENNDKLLLNLRIKSNAMFEIFDRIVKC
jgi:hypothetical protein